MGARHYDPALGRWTSADTIVPDPANPQSYNRYSWVLGNPLKYTDPTGHKEEGECGFWGEACQGAALQPSPSVPPVVLYIYGEMITNAQGGTVELLSHLNESAFSSAWADMSDWTPGIGEGRSTAALADSAAKAEAFMIFGYMVRQGGRWDPKPHIGDNFGYSQQIDGDWYYYDVWGNTMFGYLGAAAGFSESELLTGAGVEQIGSSTGYTIRHQDTSFLPKRQTGISGPAAWDDPVDRVTSQIGINLWNTYGLNVTPNNIIEAITSESGIPRQNEPWD